MLKFFKKENPKLTIHVVLDRSGSMSSIKEDTIGGFNEYVQTVARDNPNATLSLTIFDSISIDTIVDDVVIGKVPALTSATYEPRGGTPLYDAIGQVTNLLEATSGTNKALVIITDGEENQSREYTKQAIKKTLDEKQEKSNWLVVYLGANQDAFHEGAKFGTQYSNTMNFNPQNMRQSFTSTANATSRYGASGDRLKAAFTTEEREEAVK